MLLLVAVVAFVFLRAANWPDPVLPLDDAYIHFQYARSIAEGHPYQYIAGQPPSSGATSLLYPWVLAFGYGIGFKGVALATWALMIGVVCWLVSAIVLVGTLLKFGLQAPIGIVLLFLFSGSIGFAYFSGMETGLFLTVMLLMISALIHDRSRSALCAAALCALIRPEGAIFAVGLTAYLLIRERRSARQLLPFIALCALCCLIQPLLNLALTGTITASGLQAKSYLYNVPFDVGMLIRQIGNNVLASLKYFISASNALLLILAVIGFAVWPRAKAVRPLLALFAFWIVALIGTISLLETALWQYGRYQQPVLVLLIFVAAFGVRFIVMLPYRNGSDDPTGAKARQYVRNVRYMGYALVVAVSVFSDLGRRANSASATYALNSAEVRNSQMQMAEWVRANVPANAVIGVHDIGVMAYLSDHPTYDLIGLTTPNAALAARQGAGAMYEAMRGSPYRPEFMATYPDARSLTYFQNTAIFGEPLATFKSTFSDSSTRNIASATTSGQTVYRVDWSHVQDVESPRAAYSADSINGLTLTDTINVAALDDERAHNYQWQMNAAYPGFPTEFFQMRYPVCADDQRCNVMDGGRIITGSESFTLDTTPDMDSILITRVHSYRAGSVHVRVNNVDLGVRVIPEQPGNWFEMTTFIPGAMITSDQTSIEISVENGLYMPYMHWLYSGDLRAKTSLIPINILIANFGLGVNSNVNSSVQLTRADARFDSIRRILSVDLDWQHDPAVKALSIPDAKLFVHLYDSAGKLVEIAQYDGRIARGTPPANWLPGLATERVQIQVPPDVPPGTYDIAIGLYDPAGSMSRYPVKAVSNTVRADQDQRLFIGQIRIGS